MMRNSETFRFTSFSSTIFTFCRSMLSLPLRPSYQSFTHDDCFGSCDECWEDVAPSPFAHTPASVELLLRDMRYESDVVENFLRLLPNAMNDVLWMMKIFGERSISYYISSLSYFCLYLFCVCIVKILFICSSSLLRFCVGGLWWHFRKKLCEKRKKSLDMAVAVAAWNVQYHKCLHLAIGRRTSTSDGNNKMRKLLSAQGWIGRGFLLYFGQSTSCLALISAPPAAKENREMKTNTEEGKRRKEGREKARFYVSCFLMIRVRRNGFLLFFFSLALPVSFHLMAPSLHSLRSRAGHH